MKRIISFFISTALIASTILSAAAASGEPLYAIPGEGDIASVGALPDISAPGNDALEVPRIEIATENGNGVNLLKSDGYINAQISVTDTDGSVLSDAVLFKVRGNSTAIDSIPKKAFTFKFDKKTDVLGMGKAKKWTMLANCFDPTLLRNYTIFEFARELGLPYTSEQRFVELWLDGEYRGCYTVYEPVQEGKNRVDIDLESNDGKKDFLVELEALRNEEDVTYITAGSLRFAISEPDPPTAEQKAYIAETMRGIVNTLKTGDEAAIRQAIDIDSFAKYYLLNEYAKTADFNYSSVFFYYKDGLLYAGPPWDYDLSLGNLNGELSSSRVKEASVSDGITNNVCNFYPWLCDKEWFMQEVKRIYAQHYDYIESISSDGGLLDSLREQYSSLFTRNFSVWQVGRWWINYQKKPFVTYDENYQYLKTWCAERNTWLTGYYGLYRYGFVRGDADDNGDVEILDVTLIQRVLSAIRDDADGGIAVRGALSGDTLDITDATLIQRYLAGMNVNVPVAEPAEVIRY